MTRDELLAMIYEDNTVRSCPTEEIKCELEDAEINTQEYCKKCAEMLLTEYENKIRADERAKVIGLLYETNMNCHNCHCNDECNFSKADCIEFLSKYISEMLGK